MSVEPRLQFFQINDLHFRDFRHELDTRTFRDANIRTGWLLEALRKPGVLPPADFILAIGDMVHGESIEALERECTTMAAALNELPVEVFPAMGNHEIKDLEGDPEWERPFRDAYSVNDHYSFEREGIAFIVFNNAGTGEHLSPASREKRLGNLKRLLTRHHDQPKIISCHIPLVCVRDEPVLVASSGFPAYKCLEPEILEAIEEESDSVLAVLGGHVHITGCVVRKDIHHLIASGPASFPHDIVHYSVFEDRIDVQVIQLPSNLWLPETNLHGATRHGRDFTDSRHPTALTYIRGNPDERRFSIPRT